MSNLLEAVHNEFDRDDQQIKRDIAEYIWSRPGQWIAKQELVDQFDIDESGVGRHLDRLHDFGAVKSKKDEGKRYVKWNGRGVGGVRYWIRRTVPDELWVVGENLRAFVNPTRLGGAFVPTMAFVILLGLGLVTAFMTIVFAYLPGDALFGITVLDTLAFTGAFTVMASLLLVLVPVARLLEAVLWRLVPRDRPKATDDDSDDQESNGEDAL